MELTFENKIRHYICCAALKSGWYLIINLLDEQRWTWLPWSAGANINQTKRVCITQAAMFFVRIRDS